MEVKKLGNRVLEIYFSTILLGTLISSTILGINSGSFELFLNYLLYGTITTAFICTPNLIILITGLEYTYKHSFNIDDRDNYLYYTWFASLIIPLSLFFSGKILLLPIIESSFNPTISLSLPYIFAALIFIFMVNKKYDKKYPIKFKQDDLHEDILDTDLD